MRRTLIAALAGAGILAAVAAGLYVARPAQQTMPVQMIAEQRGDTLALLFPIRPETVSIVDTVMVTDTVELPCDCEPQDTTPEAVAAAVPGGQHVLLVGDTVTIRPNLLDADGDIVPTAASEWNVDFDPAFVAVSQFHVTALAPTPVGSSTLIAYKHAATQLSTEADIVVLKEIDPPDPGEWPDNEPPAMTPLVSIDGSTLQWGAGWQSSTVWQDAIAQGGSDRVRVVVDPGSKHGRAIEKRGYVGHRSTWFAAGPQVGDIADHRELYIRLVFRFSPNWQFHASGINKLFYYGRRTSGCACQYFINVGAGNIDFVNQAGPEGGSIDGRPLPSVVFRAQGMGGVSRGVYHTIEVVHRLNSAPGAADGSLRMWYDGVEVESFAPRGLHAVSSIDLRRASIEWIDSGWAEHQFNGGQWFLFFGGQGDEKRIEDWIRLSELYVSGRN